MHCSLVLLINTYMDAVRKTGYHLQFCKSCSLLKWKLWQKKQMFLQLASCGYDIYFVYVTKSLVLLCVYTKGTHRITPRNCNDPCSHNTKTHLYVIFIAIEVSRSNIYDLTQVVMSEEKLVKYIITHTDQNWHISFFRISWLQVSKVTQCVLMPCQ